MIARSITAELVEGNGRVYAITDSGRAELDAYLSHLDVLKSDLPGAGNHAQKKDAA